MRFIILVLVLIFQSNFCFAWDEVSARKEAFKNVQQKVDVSQYLDHDPYHQENLKAMMEGRNRIGNRYMTAHDFGYMVSEIDANGEQKITMSYDPEGNLQIIRLISAAGFPRTEYIYCASNECKNYGKTYHKGDLMRVTFHPEVKELFFFKPDGTFDGRSGDN